MEEKMKVSSEILGEYFEKLKLDERVDHRLREGIYRLWEEKKLNTPTYLKRLLDDLRSGESEGTSGS